VRVDTLAQAFGIPANYLVQILLELKSQNLVRSQRGKEGGYLLGRPAAEITLGDVVRSVHGQGFDTPAMHNAECPAELQAAWRGVQAALEAALDAVNFQQLAEAGSDKDRMYYI
jgi:Rrf2 family protein